MRRQPRCSATSEMGTDPSIRSCLQWSCCWYSGVGGDFLSFYMSPNYWKWPLPTRKGVNMEVRDSVMKGLIKGGRGWTWCVCVCVWVCACACVRACVCVHAGGGKGQEEKALSLKPWGICWIPHISGPGNILSPIMGEEHCFSAMHWALHDTVPRAKSSRGRPGNK